MDVRTTIENFADEVRTLVGNVEMSINHSETDFGKSSYLYVGPFKIRCSDHGVGTQRVFSELHLHDITKQSILDRIERYFFPDRFQEVESLTYGDVQLASENKIKGLTYEYKMLGYVRESSKGNKMYNIRVKNVRTTEFVRI